MIRYHVQIIIYLCITILLMNDGNVHRRDTRVESIDVLLWCGFSWTGFGNEHFKIPNYLGQSFNKTQCPVECKWIGDKNKIDQVDAVVFEAQPLGNFGYAYLKETPPFPQKDVGQKFINFGFEHEDYFPIQTEPGYLAHIDANATFRQFNQIPLTFTCSWGMYENGSIDNFKDAYVRPYNEKLRVVAFMATNCMGGGAIYRTNYIKDMMTTIQVDAMGECIQNKKLSPEEFPKPVFADLGLSMKIKREVFSRYLFSLAFENNNKTDYVSEKVYTCLLSGSLPIYMGAPNIDDFVPRNSVIKTNDFESPQHLVKYLKYLMTNETAYNEYFEWKKEVYPEMFKQKYSRCAFYAGDCDICKYVHKLIEQDKVKNGDHNATLQHRIDFGEPKEVKKFTRVGKLKAQSCLIVKQTSDLVPEINDEFTFAAWIHPEASQSRTLFAMGDANSAGGKMINISIVQVWRRFYVQYCLVSNEGGGDYTNGFGELDEVCITGERSITHGDWKHIAVTITREDVDGHDIQRSSIYVNGLLDVTERMPAHTTLKASNVMIGCKNNFEGLIDDIVIRRYAMSQQEIYQLMFEKLRGDEPGLTTYITFSDNAAVSDYSKYKSPIQNTAVEIIDTPLRKLDLNNC
ncbi:glycosyltransferase [Cavenderia fasciculata]|uniref:Fucosyltransferase n=1 Tax=Cavenderia fasciculata TaxID=261658 RepID=F4PXL4_CACFS|nr:glycosyltransferase [Cavenderia fasciculata]EGG19524.1 glycosyltransferase [Cavenderia fasciculata]|eukprot:XP_004357818.1 glycosyltransferase [Cavenderia fasciculata]